MNRRETKISEYRVDVVVDRAGVPSVLKNFQHSADVVQGRTTVPTLHMCSWDRVKGKHWTINK